MKQKRSLPVRYKYAAMFLLITVLVVASLIPIYQTVYNVTRDNSLHTSTQTLQRGGAALESHLSQLSSLTQLFNTSASFAQLKLFAGDTLPTNYYYKLYTSHQFFRQQISGINLLDEGFVIFLNNNAILTRSRVYDDALECFDSYLRFSEYEPGELYDYLLMQTDQTSYLQSMEISINMQPTQSYLMAFSRRSAEQLLGVSLISENKLAELFESSDYPENSFLYIINYQGELVFDTRYEKNVPILIGNEEGRCKINGELFTLIGQPIYGGKYQVIRGIPESYFSQQMMSFQALFSRYLVVVLFLGILLSFLFLFYSSYRPLKKLVNMPMIQAYRQTKPLGNEYNLLHEAMQTSDLVNKRLSAEVQGMEHALRATLFVRLLQGGVHTTEEIRAVKDLLWTQTQSYRVAVIQCGLEGSEEDINLMSVWVYDQLRKAMEGGSVLGRLNKRKFALLLPDDPPILNAFEKIACHVNGNALTLYGIQLRIGVSEPVLSMGGVQAAFHQAQLVPEGEAERPVVYCSLPDKGEAGQSMQMADVQRLYELIYAGEVEAIGEIMEHMQQEVHALPRQAVREVYHTICFVLRIIVQELSLLPQDFSFPEYQGTDSTPALMGSITEAALGLSELVARRKSSGNKPLINDMIAFIQERFAEPQLSISMIAEHFSISEKHVYRLVREHTGNSPAGYIEGLRMRLAIDLLKGSDLSVAQIASRCGYGSSNNFYKAFKKTYGRPPSNFRSIPIKTEDAGH